VSATGGGRRKTKRPQAAWAPRTQKPCQSAGGTEEKHAAATTQKRIQAPTRLLRYAAQAAHLCR
jgi:hypothetical protein